MGSKYKPLEKFLGATPTHIQEITLSFVQIEMIIRERLPNSHLDHQQWWENQTDTSNRPQARAWLNAGFEVKDFKQDKASGWVTFSRIKQ
jgi:hypothetical protein